MYVELVSMCSDGGRAESLVTLQDLGSKLTCALTRHRHTSVSTVVMSEIMWRYMKLKSEGSDGGDCRVVESNEIEVTRCSNRW